MTDIKMNAIRFVMIVLIFGLWNIDQTEADRHKWRSLMPSDFIERAMLKVYETELIYYGFDANTPLAFKVQGPTQVRVLTRLRYIPGMEGEQSYELILSEDGVEKEKVLYNTTESEKASYVEGTDMSLGKAMRIEFAVDDTSSHTYEIRLSKNTGKRVEARVFKLRDNVEITPIEYAQSITAFLSESRERTYYLLTREHPVKVRVRGPTRMEVHARLDYNPGMVGKQMYILKVLQDDKTLKSFHIESVRSSTVSYEDRPTIVPGAAKTLQIEVPEGPHTYEFRLPNLQFKGVALRFLIPAKSVR